MSMVKRFLTLVLCAAMILSVTACGKSTSSNDNGGTQSPSSATSNDSSGKSTSGDSSGTTPTVVTYANEWAKQNDIPNAFFKYPMEGNPEVTWWFPLDGFISVGAKDMNNHEVFQEVQKRTGIKIKFIHPAVGQAGDAFAMMIASNELPDIITWSNMYKGGVTAGIDDGYFIDHKEVIDKWSPNYKYYRENDELRRRTTMDDKGRVLGYYNLAPYSEWMWLGLLIKKEALEKTGMQPPETISEWEDFLTKCKEVGYDGGPYTQGAAQGTEWMGSFNAAYGAFDWVFVDENGKAAWGPIQPGTREFLQTFARWYKNGLIDKEYATRDWANRMAFAQSNKCAVITDSPDTMWGIWKVDCGIDFVGVPNAVLNKGDKPKTVYLHPKNGGWETSITTACKNMEVAARLLDYGYTWDGYVLYNFGLPGKTHEIDENGKPYYPENSSMWNPNDDVPLSNRVWKYKVHQGPFIREEHNSNPLIVSPGSYSGAIRKLWTESTDARYNMPPVSFTPEEATREAELGNQLSTLRNEVFTKIIYGEKPIEEWDKFVEKVKSMGYDEFIGLWQAALDRFNAR